MTFDPEKFSSEIRIARDRREAKLRALRDKLDDPDLLMSRDAAHLKAKILDSEIMTLNVIMAAVDMATTPPPPEVTEKCLSCGAPSRPNANTCWGCTVAVPE